MIYDLIFSLQILIVAMSVLSGILGGVILNLRATRAARQVAPVDDGDSSGKFPISFDSLPSLLFFFLHRFM